MTTMTEQDEARLRARLHSIGDAIEQCHDEGRAEALAPRGSHRYTVTVAVAAAAVLVLVAVAAVVTRGGDASTVTRVANGSGVLEGLRVTPPPRRAFVATNRGLVVVANSDDAHGRRPSVYAPGPHGVYRWYVNTEVPGLRPGPAWLVGDTIHTVGYVCSPDEMGETMGQNQGRCGSQPLVALSFSLRTMEWSEAVEIEDHGLQMALRDAAGNGRYLVAPVTDDPGVMSSMPLGLARVDVTDGSMMRLQGTVVAPLICPSGDTFVIGTGMVLTYLGESGEAPEANPDGVRSHIGVVEGNRIAKHSIYVDVETGDDGLVGESGCADDGMVMTPDVPSSVEPWPLVAVADHGGASVSVQQLAPLPSGWASAGSVSYGADSTGSGSALTARGTVPDAEDDETTTIGVWNPATKAWTRLDKPVPPIPVVVVDRQGNIFIIDQSGDAPDGPWLLHGPLGS